MSEGCGTQAFLRLCWKKFDIKERQTPCSKVVKVIIDDDAVFVLENEKEASALSKH